MPVTNNIENRVRLNEFNPVSATTSFPLDYPLYAAADLTALKDDLDVVLDNEVTSAYSITATYRDGVTINPVLVFDPGITGNLQIYSRRDPRTSFEAATGRAITAKEFNSTINTVLASLRDVSDNALQLPLGVDATRPFESPRPQALKALRWNIDAKALENYNPTTGLGAEHHWPLTIWQFGAEGDGVNNDHLSQLAGWEFSITGGATADRTYQPQVEIFYPSGKYLLGVPGSTEAAMLLSQGPGPVIRGQGYNSWICRAPGFGNPVSEGVHSGGRGWFLIQMEQVVPGTFAYVTNPVLRDLAFGPDDPDLDQPLAGGHSIRINAQGGLISGIHARNPKGIFLRGTFDGTLIENISAWNCHPHGGGTIRIDGAINLIVANCPHVESSDDCIQFNIKSHSNVLFLDPADPDYEAKKNLFYNVQFTNINSSPIQGSCYAYICGGLGKRSSSTVQAKTIEDTNRVRIRQYGHDLNVGDPVLIADAIDGGGLAAATEVNGVRTVVETGVIDGTFWEFTPGGTITSDDSLGQVTTATYIRIGMTSGSPTVTLFIPNHGIPLGETGMMRLLSWNTPGLAAGDVDGLREVTAIDFGGNTTDYVTFEADANASLTLDISDVPASFADPDMALGTAGPATINGLSFNQMRGTSGDSAVTGVGGVAIKLLHRGSYNPASVSIFDSDITHADTVDRPHTVIFAIMGPFTIEAVRDVKRSPRGPCMIAESDTDGDGSVGRLGIHAGLLYNGIDCLFEGPANADAPTVCWDGGTLKLYRSKIYCGGQHGIVAANDYALAGYQGDGPRLINPDTSGFDGGPLVVEYLSCVECEFLDIPNGKFGLYLGHLKGAYLSKNKFVRADGATSAGAISMKAPSAGIGTTNVLCRDNDYSEVDITFANFVPNAGNVRDDIATFVLTAGAPNAQTVTLVPAMTSLITGRQLTNIKAGFSNTGAMTLDVNGLGAKAVNKQGAAGLAATTGNEIRDGSYYDFLYDAAAAAGAGAWIVKNPSA